MRSAVSALLLTLCAALAPAATLQYKPATTIATGFQNLSGLAVADFNGDGKPDIAVTDSYGKNVVIYLNKGDGTFASPVSTPLTIDDSVGLLLVGDFNEDGRPDLVAATISGDQVLLPLMSKGDGTFNVGQALAGSFGGLSGAVVDQNHDKHLDLLIGGNGPLYSYLGDGHGNFTLQAAPPAGGYGAFLGVAASDFNQDGNIDLATSPVNLLYGSAGLLIDRGNGDGTFTSSSTLHPDGVINPEVIVTADFNRDGKPDLLIGEPNVALIAFGNGDGTFTSETGFSTPTPTIDPFNSDASPIVATADMNADGIPDVVIADNPSSTIDVFLSDGTGFFPQAAPDFTTPTAFGSGAIALADLNQDGLQDIVVTNYKIGLVTVLLSTRARATPTITLSGATSQLAGAPLNVTVAVTGAQGLPTGSVTLLDGTTSVATQPLTAAGDASFSISSLAAGTHALTASFSGDSIYLPLSSTAFAATISDFQLALSTTTQTVTHGNAATFSIAINPVAGFTGSVSATCSGLPAGYACSATPVSLNGQGASLSVVVSPAKTASSLRLPDIRSGALFCFVLATLLPFGRKRLPSLLVVCIAIGTLATLTGCSSGSSSASSPSPHSTAFTINVTATQGMETISHQVAATLIVQP